MMMTISWCPAVWCVCGEEKRGTSRAALHVSEPYSLTERRVLSAPFSRERARAICVRSSCLLVFFFFVDPLSQKETKKTAGVFFPIDCNSHFHTFQSQTVFGLERVRARARACVSRASEVAAVEQSPLRRIPPTLLERGVGVDLMSVARLSRKFFNTQKDGRKYRSSPAAKKIRKNKIKIVVQRRGFSV